MNNIQQLNFIINNTGTCPPVKCRECILDKYCWQENYTDDIIRDKAQELLNEYTEEEIFEAML